MHGFEYDEFTALYARAWASWGHFLAGGSLITGAARFFDFDGEGGLFITIGQGVGLRLM